MPIAQTQDLSIYYEIRGEGSPLFFVGGFTQNSNAWDRLASLLVEHYRVITFDNRGVGQTEAPHEKYTIGQMANDVDALMTALGIDSGYFLGQSMGSAIIQQLCLSHPKRVQKAILCAPFAKLPNITKHNMACELELLQQGIERRMVMKLHASWLLSNQCLENPENAELFVDQLLCDPHPPTVEGLLGQAAALYAFDLEGELHKITHPLLLLTGERDITTPLYCAEMIQQSTQNVVTHMFQKMGHAFPTEIPEQVAQKVESFLSA